MDYHNLSQALQAPPRENAEGLVVVLPHKMMKIKQEDYLILHKLMTGLRPRSIWEFLAVNACKHLIEKPKHWGSRIGLDPARAQEIIDIGPDWKKTYLEKVPDEFLQWVDDTIEDIEHSVWELSEFLRDDAGRFMRISSDRRSYFENIKGEEHFGLLGLLYDDRDITTGLWKSVYPSAEGKPFVEQGEDIA
jgi:RNA ligase